MKKPLNIFLLILTMIVAACSTPGGKPDGFIGTRQPPDPNGGTYKVGEPYQIKGVWYYPSEDYSYDETGIASWYGPGFHTGRTSNGEAFDTNELTAAHPTLPMPSLARVTNLDNGRSIVVRINDRGPFSGGRIMDVSRRAAQMLGFEKSGTAKVRVQVLADESKAIAAAAKRYGATQAGKAYANSTFSNAPLEPVATKKVAPRIVYQPPQPPPPEHVPSDEKSTPQELPVMTQVPVKPDPQIYVQAGAFTVAENAEKLQKEMQAITSTEINRATMQNTVFYRVRLGPLPTVAKANAVLKQVQQAGVPEPRIIVD